MAVVLKYQLVIKESSLLMAFYQQLKTVVLCGFHSIIIKRSIFNAIYLVLVPALDFLRDISK